MVVKSATKKKLMDIGFPQVWAHKMADDAKWDAILDMDKEELTNKVLSAVGWATKGLEWTEKIKFSKEDELLWEELIVNALNMYKITKCIRFHTFETSPFPENWFEVIDNEDEAKRMATLFSRLSFLKGHWGKRATEDWEYCNGMTKKEFLIGYNQLKEVAQANCPYGKHCKQLHNLYTESQYTKSPIINWPIRNPMDVKE